MSQKKLKIKKGDTVEAVVLAVDKNNKKISLGVKQLQQDPWDTIEKEYPINSTIEGVVSKITNFGAFVKLPSGIEGLVHISELANHNVNKVEDVLKVGQKEQFRVINVNKEERRLGLSLKKESTSEAPARETERKERPSKSATDKVEKQQKSTMSPKTKNLFQLELEKYAARNKGSNDSEDKE